MCSLVFDCVCADGFGKVKGHLMFVEAVFVCLHWQMDGVCRPTCVGSGHSWRLIVPQTLRAYRESGTV